MSEQQAVGSFLPADFSEGGFFDDVKATIVKAEVVAFDYQGQRADDPSCAIAVTYHPDDAADDEDDRTEYYGIGKLSKFTPTSDGKFYVPTGPSSHMNKGSKGALYLRALQEKGFDMNTLSTGINALEGLHVHLNQVPMPEMKPRPGEEKREKKAMVLLVSAILEPLAPAGKKAAPAAKKKAAAAAPAAGAAAAAPVTTVGGEDVDEETAGTLQGIILNLLEAKKGGPFAKTLVPGVLFKEVTDTGLRNRCMKAMANVAWLSGEDQPWTYDGGNLSSK